MDYDPGRDRPAPPYGVRERVSVPGVFLCVVAVLNMLAALYLLWVGVHTLLQTEQQRKAVVRELWQALTPELKKMYTDRGVGPDQLEEILKATGPVATGWGGAALLAGLLSLAGAISMMRLRAYGLAMAGAILAAVPFVSPMGCCLVGEAVGLWALIVLLNSDVRAGFLANTRPPAGEPPALLS